MSSVALLHYSYPPVVGGVEEVMRHQAAVLAAHGHDVTVVAGTGGTVGAGDAHTPGSVSVNIHPLLASNAPEALAATGAERPEALPQVVDRVQAVLDETLTGCDVLLAHNVLSMPFNLPLTMAVRRLAAGRLAVVGWNHDSPYFYDGYDPRLDSEPWRILRDPDPRIRWVTISHARADEFSDLFGGQRPQVIRNGVDPHTFLKLGSPISALIQEQRLFDADLVLLQPSRLHPRKNIELSVRVLAALRAQDVDARLLITGAHDPHDQAASGYAGRLHALAVRLGVAGSIVLIAEHVLAGGDRLVASQLATRDLYQVADVLFLPSRSEGFGLPLLEAGLIRLPVACADIPPFREVCGDEGHRFALTTPPEQIAADLLAFLATLPTHRLYRRVVREFTWERIYQVHLCPLLQELTAA